MFRRRSAAFMPPALMARDTGAAARVRGVSDLGLGTMKGGVGIGGAGYDRRLIYGEADWI